MTDGGFMKGSRDYFMDHKIEILTYLVSQKFRCLHIMLEFTLLPRFESNHFSTAVFGDREYQHKELVIWQVCCHQ